MMISRAKPINLDEPIEVILKCDRCGCDFRENPPIIEKLVGGMVRAKCRECGRQRILDTDKPNTIRIWEE